MCSRAGLLVLSLGVQGCAAEAERTRTVSRDSVGVTIVETTAPLWGEEEAWLIDPEPVLDLTAAGTGPEHEFYHVRNAARLRDGSIAVASPNEVRVYSTTGALTGRYGAAGAGPGEFRRLTSVHPFRGDSLFAYDYWQRRITIFELGGAGSRTIELGHLADRLWRAMPLDNGRIVGISNSLDEPVNPGLYRFLYTIIAFDPDGEHVDTLAGIPGADGFQFDRGDARPLFAKDGYVALHGDRVYLGYGDSMRIDVHDSSGTLERIMRVPGYDLRLTADELEAEREALRPPAGAPAFIREVVETLPDPETRPAYSDVLVDAAGFVWAPQYHGRAESDRPTDCAIFSPDGEWLGTVRLPARFTAFEIGLDYVLGVQLDDVDAEHVQLLRLNRTG